VNALGPVQLHLSNDALGTYDFQAADTPQSSLWLKYPAASMDSYLFRGQNFSIRSTSDTTTVPAGTFVCYHIVEPFHEYWFAPDVGIVKMLEFTLGSAQPDTVGVVELLHYHLK